MTLTGFAVCAHTFCAHNIIHAPLIAMGFLHVLTANKNELCALSKGRRRWCWGCGLGAGAVSWLSARLRRAATLVGRWCQLVVRAVEAP